MVKNTSLLPHKTCSLVAPKDRKGLCSPHAMSPSDCLSAPNRTQPSSLFSQAPCGVVLCALCGWLLSGVNVGPRENGNGHAADDTEDSPPAKLHPVRSTSLPAGTDKWGDCSGKSNWSDGEGQLDLWRRVELIVLRK